MLFPQTSILNRHPPARKVHHARAQMDMLIRQWGLFRSFQRLWTDLFTGFVHIASRNFLLATHFSPLMARSQETALLPGKIDSFCHRELPSMLLNISA
jgi:hypothetical protein